MPPLKVRQQAGEYERTHKDASVVSSFIAGYEYAQQESYLDATMVDDAPVYDNKQSAEPIVDFETIWKLYDRRDNKQSALKAWKKLNPHDKFRAYSAIPDFVKAHPDKKFRPMLATYLNQKRFNDEEIISNGNNNQPTEQEKRFSAYATAISNVGR